MQPTSRPEQPVSQRVEHDEAHHAPAERARPFGPEPQVILYSHSSLFYWWPVWVTGYILAAMTYWGGKAFAVAGDNNVWFYPSSNLGVIFLLVLFLVILITNVTVRGMASALVIVTGILITVLLAWFGLWDRVLNWIGNLRIYLNLGAYFWFSTLVLLVWVFSVFVFDRLSYWRFTPGQATLEHVFGASAKSYDTENMVVEKYRNDFFRHWVLGFGSGDLNIKPYSSERESIEVANVLFIGWKVAAIQRLMAMEPVTNE